MADFPEYYIYMLYIIVSTQSGDTRFTLTNRQTGDKHNFRLKLFLSVFLSTILGCTNLSINTLMCIAHVHNTQCWRTYELQYLELTFFQIIDISRAMIIFRYCCLGNSCNTENYITLRCVNHNIRLNSFSRICEWILPRWVLF